MFIHCLGAAAGGGYPQWNCACAECRAARIDPGRADLHAALAVSGTGERWFLINATPDVAQQIASDPALHPGPGVRETPIEGVLLTDAEFDHTIGLLALREGAALRVFGTAPVLAALSEEFPVRTLLADYASIDWNEVVPGEPVPLDEVLTVTALRVGTKQPRYVNSLGADGAVVAYRLTDAQTGSTAVYAPGLSALDGAIEAELKSADCVLVDGTFWSDDEMARTGTGDRTGRDMGHLAMSGRDGSVRRLGGLPARHLIYTHINNTNPVWDESSPQYQHLVAKGIRIGRAGLRLEL